MSHFIKEDIKMFEALVLACLLDKDCIELQDRRGPYKTEVECKARVAEMMRDFVTDERTPPVVVLQFKCTKPEGINT